MRTIQMTLDDDLVSEVDELVKKLHTNRSAYTRDALRQALRHNNDKEKELRHKHGYTKNPVQNNEFSVWEAEQNWGDNATW